MDDASSQGQRGLEDQLRNMILSSNPPPYHFDPPSPHQPHMQSTRPTVRLPPAGQHGPGHAPVLTANDWRSPNGLPTQAPIPPRQFPQPDYVRTAPAQQRGGMQHARFHPNSGANGMPPPQQYGGQDYNAPNYHQQQPVDPNAFQRRRPPAFNQQAPQQRRQLYQPNGRGSQMALQSQSLQLQAQYLESVAAAEVPIVEMSQAERDEKDAFRKVLQDVCDEVREADPERLPRVSIECFGSFASGFASAGSDMDLVTVVQGADASGCFSVLEDDLPRALEKRLLQLGYGARLLTRTRVPIIKVCQKPESSLLSKLRQERERWDALDNDKKYPHLHKDQDEHAEDDMLRVQQDLSQTAESKDSAPSTEHRDEANKITTSSAATAQIDSALTDKLVEPARSDVGEAKTAPKDGNVAPQSKREPWTRERKAGPLDFPKDGVGVQSDINFFNPLGLHNTQMLRCYSLCDQRVRLMVLFVKSWAKRRKINSSYSGTLSSYGYVLMVLHFLMNIANPPVIPNLQMPWRPLNECTPQGADRTMVDEWEVDFWRREAEISSAAQQGLLSGNRSSLGELLAGFFNYYSSQGGYPSFHWMGEVLSLRVRGGLQTKEEKGWVKAVTEQGDGKQVQHRYLFCIEDPFELQHNVARTVTHNGIVAIRDEFRRANRILRAVGGGMVPGGGMPSRDGWLFDELVELPPPQQNLQSAGMVDGFQRQQNAPSMRQIQPSPRNNAPCGPAPPKIESFDVKDNDAFPALGPAKPAPTPPAPKNAARKRHPGNEAAGEISGDNAKAYLDELRRKKAEEPAA